MFRPTTTQMIGSTACIEHLNKTVIVSLTTNTIITTNSMMSTNKAKSGSPVPNSETPAPTTETTDTSKNMSKETSEAPDPKKTEESTGDPKPLMGKEKLEAARKRASEATLVTQAERTKMFNSGEEGTWAAKSMISPKLKLGNEGGYMLMGRTIGGPQTEPDWTPEQRKMIAQVVGTERPIA
ncbi:uncharacterized protein A1O5_02519 [Cladophialophora psammophila CBS 110553]|uniref:Uncharacterized protein n=1 Tax=Cladophialophora psammophila CBS 110553 TaxID=1182543 RepID=W9XVD7_9EURO|nr:uncharacterized protein A1O5_02519 [Cladophialophora psammophila CBS 110553]EXJ74224.1 hypothetical protein A1O5_02519 [Cladophialophora psammophila CBS 110553]